MKSAVAYTSVSLGKRYIWLARPMTFIVNWDARCRESLGEK